MGSTASRKKNTVPNEFMFGSWSELPEVFAVPDPDASTLGIHRKALRTTVKQTRLAMYGAQLALKGISDVGRPEWGAYLRTAHGSQSATAAM